MDRVRDDDQFKLKAITETDYFRESKILLRCHPGRRIFDCRLLDDRCHVCCRKHDVRCRFQSGSGNRYAACRWILTSHRVVFFFDGVAGALLLGGLLGCLATIPLNGISGGTQNAATFSEITFSFRFGPKILMQGMALAVAMGLVGGLLPAIRAVRLQITDALRQR